MENQHQVEQMRLLRSIALVRARHAQQIFRNRQLRQRIVEIERVPLKIVPLCHQRVRRNQRETRDQLDGLPQNIFGRRIVRVVVKGIEGQDAPRQLVHNVAARRF